MSERKSIINKCGPIFVFLIFVGACYLLYLQISKYSYDEIVNALGFVPPSGVVISCVLMLVNYGILAGYDWLAIKGIHKSLPLCRVGLVSFIGQAVSYNFGALLGGTAVRYRFYREWGFTPGEIVRLILMLAVTFWVGALGLIGGIFFVTPPSVPEELGVHLSLGLRPLGLLLFLLAVAYLIATHFCHRPIIIHGTSFALPSFRIAVAQAAVAGADLVCAGACLYVLLPPSVHIAFIVFLPAYLLGMVLVVLSHVPGGVGVLEVVILSLTAAEPKDVFAALICFRAIYYLVPLVLATVLFAGYELRLRLRRRTSLVD